MTPYEEMTLEQLKLEFAKLSGNHGSNGIIATMITNGMSEGFLRKKLIDHREFLAGNGNIAAKSSLWDIVVHCGKTYQEQNPMRWSRNV